MSQVQKELEFEKKLYNEVTSTKPRGFWYGIDNSWIDWCSSEMPEWITDFKYEVELDDTNIKKLLTVEDMLKFNREYVIKDKNFNFNMHIDWIRLKNEGWKGIEIPNYFYQLRMNSDFFWYYGWDVACGCVWDTNIITKITKI